MEREDAVEAWREVLSDPEADHAVRLAAVARRGWPFKLGGPGARSLEHPHRDLLVALAEQAIAPRSKQGQAIVVPALVATAEARNKEIVDSISALDDKTNLVALKKRMEFFSEDAQKLVVRAAMISPISKQQAQGLATETSALKERMGFEQQERINKLLDKMSKSDKAQFRALVSHAVARQSWVIEYLKNGHVELSEPTTEGERIACERIEIIRRVNRMAAGVIKGHKFKEPLNKKSHQEIAEILDELFSPIQDDLDQAGNEMIALGERRYGLEKSDVGDMRQYTEQLTYERMMQGFVLTQSMAFLSTKPKVYDSIAKITRGSQDIDGAEFGRVPDGVRKKKEAEDQAIADRAAKEAEQARLAALRAAAERNATADQPGNHNGQSKPPSDSLARNETASDNPFESPGMSDSRDPAVETVGPGGGFPGSRFGPRGFPRGGPNRSGPSGFGNPGDPSQPFGSPSGGRPGANGRPTGPPVMNPETSVTITMNNASGIDSRAVSNTFQSLKVATSVRISNGKMEAKIGFAGDVQEVADLIQFGKVESVDKPKRTIVVVPK